MGEFELIRRYFQHALPSQHLALRSGDDCALLTPVAGQTLAISTDMLVQGRHFFADTCANGLGHKALAVNLSDLAAMGAQPVGFSLALSLPQVNPDWLDAFSKGLLAIANAHQCVLIGGDTTAGPLNICITIFGHVPLHQALRRGAAQVGDDVYVSGQLGDARLALDMLNHTTPLDDAVLQATRHRLERPTPRIALGMALRGVAHAAIDLSDGLVGDLQHVLAASGVGATLHSACWLQGQCTSSWVQQQPLPDQYRLTLSGGDDYELLFTAPVHHRDKVQQAAQQVCTAVHRIGRIDAKLGLRVLDQCLQPLDLHVRSFDHFA